jgi:hypothetical protein
MGAVAEWQSFLSCPDMASATPFADYLTPHDCPAVAVPVSPNFDLAPTAAVLTPWGFLRRGACRKLRGRRSTSPSGVRVRLVGLLTAATLLPAASLADCAAEAPAAARQFWEGHSHFYERTDPTLRDVTTPRFYAALEREWACIGKNTACVAYVPWPHPGDMSIAGHPTFYVSLDRADHVLVSMNYAFRGSYGKAGPQQFVIMTLIQEPDSRCWLLDDLVTARQGSFRERFHRPDS